MAIIVTLAFGACTSTSWTRAGATPEELNRDRRICIRYANGIGDSEAARSGMERSAQRATQAALHRCMETRGWVDERGQTAAATEQ